jgi:hypothetical protein
MPAAILAAMKHGYSRKHLSREEINHRVYGHLNNAGLMHGSKETAAGVEAEARYEADHASEMRHARRRRKALRAVA